jgi:hypothetical protein
MNQLLKYFFFLILIIYYSITVPFTNVLANPTDKIKSSFNASWPLGWDGLEVSNPDPLIPYLELSTGAEIGKEVLDSITRIPGANMEYQENMPKLDAFPLDPRVGNFDDEEIVITICEGDFYDFFGQSLTVSGTYQHVYQDDEDNDVTVILHLTVESIIIETMTVHICLGLSYDFVGQILTQSGIYTNTFENDSGCATLLVLELIVDQGVIFFEGASSFCAGESTQICVSEDFDSLSWSTGSTDPCIVVSGSGVYTVVGTSQEGCVSVGQIFVMEAEVPLIQIVGPLVLNCPDASIEICLDMFESVSWSTGQIADCILITEPGTYSLTVTYFDGCTTDASFTITSTVDEITVSDVLIIHPTDDDGNGALSVELNGGYMPFTYNWLDDSGTIVSTALNATDLMPGIYFLRVLDATGCEYLFGPFELILTTSTKDIHTAGIHVFPNPFNTMVFIEMENPVMISGIHIRSVTGSILKQIVPDRDLRKMEVDLHMLPPGTYFLELIMAGKPLHHTMIKME